jgi:hypothetical protein
VEELRGHGCGAAEVAADFEDVAGEFAAFVEGVQVHVFAGDL